MGEEKCGSKVKLASNRYTLEVPGGTNGQDPLVGDTTYQELSVIASEYS